MATRPFVESGAGYVQRSIQQFPRQGAEGPWQISNDHRDNLKTFRHGPVADENLRFGSALGSSPMGRRGRRNQRIAGRPDRVSGVRHVDAVDLTVEAEGRLVVVIVRHR